MVRDGTVLTVARATRLALHIDTICVHGDTPGADGLCNDRARVSRPRASTDGRFHRRMIDESRAVATARGDRGSCSAGGDRRDVQAHSERWWPAALRLDARRLRRHALRARAARRQRRSRADEGAGGLLGSAMLVAAAAGGIGVGWIADRFGRTRAMMLSVALYSIFTAACGFATSFASFLVCSHCCSAWAWAANGRAARRWCRSGGRPSIAARRSASCRAGGPSATRLPRSSSASCSHDSDGVRSSSSASCRRFSRSGSSVASRSPGSGSARRDRRRARLASRRCSPSGMARVTIVLTLMNTCTLFAWWGFNLWLPSYLKAPPAQGGIGLGATAASVFVFVMQIGMWFGYVTFGFVSDRFGRRRSYVAYLIAAAALLAIYVTVRIPAGTAPARSACRLCRHRLLQRIRRRHRGDLSHVPSGRRRRGSRTTSVGWQALRRRTWWGHLRSSAGFGSALLVCSGGLSARRRRVDLDS